MTARIAGSPTPLLLGVGPQQSQPGKGDLPILNRSRHHAEQPNRVDTHRDDHDECEEIRQVRDDRDRDSPERGEGLMSQLTGVRSRSREEPEHDGDVVIEDGQARRPGDSRTSTILRMISRRRKASRNTTSGWTNAKTTHTGSPSSVVNQRLIHRVSTEKPLAN